jgi:maltoporin
MRNKISKIKKTGPHIALAVALATAAAGSAQAADDTGLEFHGYSRGGPVFNYQDNIKGGLSLGGDLQKFRLGNEGDNGIEFSLGKTFDNQGTKYRIEYMPSKWGSGAVGTEQAYVEITGMSFSPEAKVWAGQRRLRIQDVHIVDNFLLNYGDNQGVGFTNVPLGGIRLGIGLFSGEKFDTPMPNGVKANRLNADFSDIQTNPGGKLRVLLNSVSGSGLAGDQNGSGVALLHNQQNFLASGLNNALYLQTSRGHARIDGEFLNVDGVGGGRTVTRIADAINWQIGAFGGQALLAYQNNRDELTDVTTKDTSFGGRISYAFSKNFKLLFEGSTTKREAVAGDQQLSKFTIAPTISVGEGFWERPEIRFYFTQSSWNDAAAAANATTFGVNGRTSTTIVGAQYEIWW